MRNLKEYVAVSVSQLSGPTADDAWHSLVEAGPAALPYVVEAFSAAGDRAVKVALVQVVCEYRLADAIPFFRGLLRDDDSEIWKVALDGLVVLGGVAALDVLTNARGIATVEKREWIDEAVGQISEAQRPG